VLACTVATVNHLPYARVLGHSLGEHDPGSRLLVLVPDDPRLEVGEDEPFELLRPSDVGIDSSELGRRALLYDPVEFACSMKAPLLRHTVAQSPDPVAFIDADCLVYADLSPLVDAARGTGLALTAHSLSPITPGIDPVEVLFLQHGTFNTGVLAAGMAGLPAVDWWVERTARHCVHDHAHGLTADQSWLALVPALFEYALVRDRGINVMGWNVFDRDVRWSDDGRPTIDGGPLRCFHFAGAFDPHRPEAFGPAPDRRAPWPPADERPGVTRVCRDYAERLLAAGYDHDRPRPFGYASLPSGQPIDPVMRETYREALLAAEAGDGEEPPNPFVSSTSAAFMSWLASPGPDGGLPRYLERTRSRRHDLREAFPAVPGDDERRFLAWAREAAERDEIDLSWLR
jgi:hypothetical protein